VKKIQLATLVSSILVAGTLLAVAAPASAQTQGMERRDNRRDTRQDARDTKHECKAGDEQSRPECRQDKRDTKQDARRN
jgi:hypothetical protein